jgi:hypothetical protein
VLISFSPSRKPFVRFLSPAKGMMPNKTFQPFLLIPIIPRISRIDTYFIVCVDTRDTQEGIKQKELSGAGSNAVQGQPQRPKAFVLFRRICNPTGVSCGFVIRLRRSSF